MIESTILSAVYYQTELEVYVDIPVVTSREPRELVEKLITYKRRGHKIAEQVMEHR